jgi:NTP pyrophosphatase (non-canonical NTP hydrolase)
MDATRTLADCKQDVRGFCESRSWDQFHNAKDLAIGIITESSELLELFRFLDAQQVDKLFEDDGKRQAIEDELADVLFFVIRFAQRFDIDLSSALQRKLEINARKYPLEKSFGSNLKYTEL